MAISISKVAVIGLGTLGAQIALQTAHKGYQVFGYDRDPAIFGRNLDKFLAVDQSKIRQTPVKVAQWPETAKKIKFCQSLAEAVSQADLVIEVVPEKPGAEEKGLAGDRPGRLCLRHPGHQLLLLARVPRSRGPPPARRRCLNLHFYQLILGQNMADVMGGTKTLPEIIEAGKEFVRSLDVVPLTVNKELLGFCFNRVWRAIKRETLYMWANGFVDFRDVDKGWMIFSDNPWGPFALMDTVGLDVIYDIEMVYYKESNDPKDRPPDKLKEMIEAGHLGVKSGQGFYTYPDPEYLRPDFLKG